MNFNELVTPCYVIDEKKLEDNLKVLKGVCDRTGAKILLAQKAFSNFCEYPLVGKYLAGTTASGLFEARLGKEEMNKENHVFCPAYRDEDFDEIAAICDHIIFNSHRQLEKFYERRGSASLGLRVNPEFSTQDHDIYDPCSAGSRLGVRLKDFKEEDLYMIDGLHMHTLCEQNSDDLAATLKVFEEKFGKYLKDLKWLNLGGDRKSVV